MSFVPTQEDIDLIFQHHQDYRIRIDLLNNKMKVIDSLEGISTESSIDIDANSDIRRSYSGTIILGKHTQVSKYSASDWIDKFVRIYIGIRSLRTGNIKWYPLGLYVFNNNGFQYSESGHTLSISCVDLISKLNGTLAGALTGSSTIIKEGSNIRKAIIDTVALAGFDKYIVDYWNRVVPYDLEFGTGATIWDILTQLRDLYYPFEMYFDDDVFMCGEIPNCKSDAVLLDNSVMDKIVIDEDTSVDYSEVRNCVEVWGASINSDAYAGTVSYSSGIYSLTISDAKLRNNAKFSFVCPTTNPASCQVKVTYGDTVAGPFYLYGSVDENGNDKLLPAGTMVAGRMYVVKYDKTNSKFYYQGQTDVHAMAMLVDEPRTAAELAQAKVDEACDNLKFIVASDPTDTLGLYNNPFTIERIGRRNNICSGGDYENIYTDELAMQRAEYELWKCARLTDSIQITTLLVPWLDVNKKVSYTPKSVQSSGISTRAVSEPVEYIIKKISISLSSGTSGTMSVTMSKFYPYYPYIIDKS